MSDSEQPTVPPGWFDDGSGRLRYWDGQQWTLQAPVPTQAQPQAQPQPIQVIVNGQQGRTANGMAVSYVRQQKGHSIVFWLFLSFFVIGVPWLIYYSASPNHYWHI